MNSLRLVQGVEPSMDFIRKEIRRGAETVQATVEYSDMYGEKRQLPITLGRYAVFADGDLAFTTSTASARHKEDRNGLLAIINGLTYLSM